jgi:hypothetical protein
LECLELSAALGALLNSIAHEMNNHLTNLVLATENARHDRTENSFDLLARQLKQSTALTSAIQRLGTENLVGNTEVVHLKAVLEEVASWDGFGRGNEAPVALELTGDPIVRTNRGQLSLAIALLMRALPEGSGRSLRVALNTEEVLRSRWSDEDQYVPMVRISLEAGGVSVDDWPPFELSGLVEGFYSGSKTPAELRVMGAWEILRKVSGRPSSRLALDRTDEGSPRFVLWLPVAADWT